MDCSFKDALPIIIAARLIAAAVLAINGLLLYATPLRYMPAKAKSNSILCHAAAHADIKRVCHGPLLPEHPAYQLRSMAHCSSRAGNQTDCCCFTFHPKAYLLNHLSVF